MPASQGATPEAKRARKDYTMSQEYLLSLCREYRETVDAIRSGRFSVEEIHQLDSERQGLHNELIRLTGYDRSADMYRVARLIIRNGGIDDA